MGIWLRYGRSTRLPLGLMNELRHFVILNLQRHVAERHVFGFVFRDEIIAAVQNVSGGRIGCRFQTMPGGFSWREPQSDFRNSGKPEWPMQRQRSP